MSDEQAEPTVEPQEEVKEAKKTRVKKSEGVPGEVKEAERTPEEEEEYLDRQFPAGKSEMSTSAKYFYKFCEGLGIEMGFGGFALKKDSLTMDLPNAYTSVGDDKQILRGHCGDLSGFCDESLSWIASAHLLEDFAYAECVKIIAEWRRVLKPGGYIMTNCPSQSRFIAHCAKTGQPGNDAHVEGSFSLETFRSEILAKTGPWTEVFVKPEHGPYSFLIVVQKP